MAIELNNYPTLLNDANLVSYYRMEGNSNDSKGSNNGTDTNVTYSLANGMFGQGAGFAGNGKILLPNGSSPTGGSARSISLWAKTSSTSIETMFSSGANGTALLFLIHLNTSAAGDVYFSSGSYDAYTAAGTISTGSFYHIVVTYSGGNLDSTTLKIYVNGVQKTLTFTATGIPLNTTNSNFALGYDQVYNTRAFTGQIDDVAIFSRALSSTEISNYYNAVLATNTGNFLAFFN